MAQAFAEILKRLKMAAGAVTDTGLAEALGIKQGSISGAKRKGVVPARWIIMIAEKSGVLSEWLLTGNGPMRIDQERHKERAETVVANRRPNDGIRVLRIDEAHSVQDAEKSDSAEINVELLQASIAAVEEVLTATEKTMSPDKKAELIVAIYELYGAKEKQVEKPRVLRLIKSVL